MMRKTTIIALAGAAMLCLAALPLHAQLPDVAGQWRLRDGGAERPVYPGEADAQRVYGFGAKSLTSGAYTRGRDEVTVLLAEFDSRERAFGLFAVAASGRRHGIVGDAFSMDRGVRHVNYGPYYLYFRASGRMPVIPDDLVNAVTRTLFSRADCYGSDIPLTMEDRVLGSEIYFPPDVRAWSDFQLPALEPVEEIVRGRAAWIARYTPQGTKLQRWLIALPVRQTDALRVLEAGILDRFASEGSAFEDCRLASYAYDDFIVFVFPGHGRLLIAVVSEDDSGGCAWALGLTAE